MRTLGLLVAIGLTVVTAGCDPDAFLVVSLHPLFTKVDAVAEPALVGLWAAEDGEGTWVFQESGENSYDLLSTENGKTAKFRAHLGRLGESLFLDISLISFTEAGVTDSLPLIHLIPAHTIWRIWIEGDVLRLAILDVRVLKNASTDETARIAREDLDEQIVITAPTQELQEFVLRHAEDAKAFPNPIELHRQN